MDTSTAPELANDAKGDSLKCPYRPMGTDVQSLPDSLREATTLATGTSHLLAHPHYEAAKTKADMDAAVRLVSTFENKIPLDKIKASGAEMILPLDTMGEGSANALPCVLGKVISAKTGLPLAKITTCEKSGGNTGVSLAQRGNNKIEFTASESVHGKKILLVDDVYISGRTILAAAEAVRRAGGEPVMVFALANGQAGRGIKPKPQNVQKLLAILQTAAWKFTRDFGFAPDQLTDSILRRLTDLNRAGRALAEGDARKRKAIWAKQQLGAFQEQRQFAFA